MRDRSAFVPCIVTEYKKALSGSAQKHSGPSEEAPIDRVAPGAASAALRALPRYLPWLQRDALHPSAPDATRVARLNQCFPSTRYSIQHGASRSIPRIPLFAKRI